MRKNRSTRILSLILAVIMVMGLFAGTAGAAEAATVSVTATTAVEVSTGGHYPVEFVLSNPTSADYSVTLSKSAGDAELTYQGTSAVNGTITLSAYTEQTVSGCLTFTDRSAQAAANVTVKVLSGATLLDIVTIAVNAVEYNGYRAASWNFDDGTQGWTGDHVSTSGDDLYIATNGGSTAASAMTTYNKPLVLIPGNLYRLTFDARAWDYAGTANHGIYAIVTDYNADGGVLGTSLYDLAVLTTGEMTSHEFRFVVSKDPDYAYSKLSVNPFATNANLGEFRCQATVDDVVLVDCGEAVELGVTNGDFETVDEAGLAGAGQGFPGWTTLTMENRGTTKAGHYGNYSDPYEGSEMMHLHPATEPYYNDTAYTFKDEVTVMGKIRYLQGNEQMPRFELHMSEYDAEGNKIDSLVDTTYFATTDWTGFQATYTKSAAAAYFKVGIWFKTAWAGAYIDDVKMYKTGAASAVTDADIAAAAPIEGVQTAVPEMSAPAIIVLISTQEQLQAALTQGSSTKLIADVTISGTQDMTGVALNGYKLNLTETASVTGVTKADVVAPKGYEVVVSGSTITVKKAQTSSGTLTHKGDTLALEGLVYINHYTIIEGIGSKDYIEANGGLLIFNEPVTEEEAIYENADPENIKTGLTYDSYYNAYLQTTDGIATKQFADEVYLRTYVQAADGIYYYGPVIEYSVQDYCDRMAGMGNANLKALCSGMLHYGTAAQTYFGYNTADPANANITMAPDTWNEALLNAVVQPFTRPRHAVEVTEMGQTLALEGQVEVNFYFNDFDAVSGKLQVWTGTVDLTDDNFTYEVPMEHSTYSGKPVWVAASKGIAAKEYGKTIYARCVLVDADGNEHYSDVIAYSPEAYAAKQIERYETSTNAKLLNLVALVKHMVMYGERARVFFG